MENISARDLRIGNLVLYLNELYVIDGITFEDAINKYRIAFKTIDGKLSNAKTEQWINPIPLTPEILEKAGFQCTKVTTQDEWGSRTEYNYSSGDVFRTVTIRHWPNAPVPYLAIGRVIIESLHQLQNLYFALTGEELNIEL